MFKRYQQLKVQKYYPNEVIEVYYLADYLGHTNQKGDGIVTKLICQVIDTDKIYHIEASDIVGIIDGVN